MGMVGIWSRRCEITTGRGLANEDHSRSPRICNMGSHTCELASTRRGSPPEPPPSALVGPSPPYAIGSGDPIFLLLALRGRQGPFLSTRTVQSLNGLLRGRRAARPWASGPPILALALLPFFL